ncbi:hypothetical protein F5148DRAFT_1184880, partial [Russula earlei]
MCNQTFLLIRPILAVILFQKFQFGFKFLFLKGPNMPLVSLITGECVIFIALTMILSKTAIHMAKSTAN